LTGEQARHAATDSGPGALRAPLDEPLQAQRRDDSPRESVELLATDPRINPILKRRQLSPDNLVLPIEPIGISSRVTWAMSLKITIRDLVIFPRVHQLV
jgi:hypothetical protein